MSLIKPTVFLDFDGTITTRDVTDAILEMHADPEWLRVEEAWETGRIGSRECLTAQMALVRATQVEMDSLLDDIEVDDCRRFERELYEFMDTNYAALLAKLAKEKKIEDALRAEITEALSRFKERFAAGAAAG